MTHVYLAEEAREDLISRNGFIYIPEVSFLEQSIVGSIGTFPVSSQVYQALRDYPAYFRAGVLGPDAYPDLLFGQGVIHPDENDPDASSLSPNANGADAWFQHLASQVQTPQQRAFYLGFLAHGAGDMFGHTFVNHYAGGPFKVTDLGNVARHLAVEGYVGNHTPPLRTSGAYAIDTSAINGFIYDTLIDARRPRNGQLGNPSLPADQKARIRIWQLTRGTAGKNPVGIFTRLRAGLEDQLDGYYAQAQYLRQKWREAADRCDWLHPGQCIKAAYYRVLLAAHQLISSIPAHYIEAWIRDINRGLRAWPATSTDVARALFMQPDGMDLSGASNVLTTYRNTYLCSMLGAPDALCSIINTFANLIQQITNSLDFLKELKRAIFAWVVERATGKTPDEWKELALAETLDPLMGAGTNAELNSLMRLSAPNADFVVEQFPAAYNTVTGIKLSFLDTRQQWQSVLGNVGWTPANPGALMDQAGFNGQLLLNHVASLDGSNQWYEKRAPNTGNNPYAPDDVRKMLLAYDCALFGRFFMQQRGDLWDHSQEWPGVPANCPELNRLQPVSPQLQCGGFDIEVGLNRSVGPIGGVVRLEALFPGGAPLPGSPRHAYLPPWAAATTVRFSQGLQNTSSGVTVQGTRVHSRLYTTSTQVSTCAGGLPCNNNVCGGTQSPTSGCLQFTYSASGTNSATVNTVDHTLTLTEGQTLQLGTCGAAGGSGTGDTYLRLVSPGGGEVAANDDSCGGLLSQLSYTVPPGGSGTYRIRAGCYASGSCSGTVAYALSGTFSFSASNTNSASQNTTDRLVQLLPGQVISLGTCTVPGASGTGDTYLRLVSPAGVEVSANDDACGGRLSHLTYTIPAGAGGMYRIRAGCYSSTSCSGTVSHALSCGVPTANSRLAMTWRVVQQTHGNSLVGFDDQTNVYTGDTSTSMALPVLCLRQDGRPVPPGITVDFYNGWAAGEVRLTSPVAGVTLTSRATADALCAQQFGAGFRMGEFHDGGGGWRWWAAGTLSTSTRFWAAINDQPANPWDP